MSWIEDKEDDGQIVKLEVGESIEGIITDKYPSIRYKTTILKLKEKEDPVEKIIVCTKILEKLIQEKEIGEKIKIQRFEDVPTGNNQQLQIYKTFSWSDDETLPPTGGSSSTTLDSS